MNVHVHVVSLHGHGDGGVVGGLEQTRTELMVVVQAVQIVDIPKHKGRVTSKPGLNWS